MRYLFALRLSLGLPAYMLLASRQAGIAAETAQQPASTNAPAPDLIGGQWFNTPNNAPVRGPHPGDRPGARPSQRYPKREGPWHPLNYGSANGEAKMTRLIEQLLSEE